MQIRPILATLKHHKAGTVLIAMQIALTLAIVCNAMFIIRQSVAHLSQPSGVDEANVLVIHNEWAGKPAPGEAASLMADDMATLRKLPGVADAYATNSYPLGGSGMAFGIGHTPDKLKYVSTTAIYFADDHALSTLGLKLVAGRNFRPDEIGQVDRHASIQPGAIIVTRKLADILFPNGTALGKTAYISSQPSTIVGIVERMGTPWVGSGAAENAGCSTLIPYRQLTDATVYVVRTRPGQLEDVRRHVRAALYAANHMRVISPRDGVQTFAEIRAQAYKSDRGMAILMGIISSVLLAVTAAGIVGLSSFWVGQRRRQIGVRRALGATRHDTTSSATSLQRTC